MDGQLADLLRTCSNYLDEDLIRFKITTDPQIRKVRGSKETERERAEDFIKYLVSVATHPIGLRASVKPFNSSQEDMLAYIMDMFNLTKNRLRKMLLGSGENRNMKSSARNPEVGKLAIDRAKKRHSWRPELRVRLDAPALFYSESIHMSNLQVRIYLFKENKIDVAQSDTEKIPDGESKLAKSTSFLNYVFRKSALDPAALIRPVNERRCLVRFEPQRLGAGGFGETRPSYKMLQVSGEGGDTKEDDIRLQIRRYYCNQQIGHILRLEFWLSVDNSRVSYLERFRKCARKMISNRCYGCCIKGKRSIYMNEDQDFYGYINIKLTELPSYSIKQSFPIVNLKNREVNSCQVSLEIRNRRLVDGEEGSSMQSDARNSTRKSGQESLFNHVRLYMNCILYQITSCDFIDLEKSINRELAQHVTIDNLFYLPAHTLINQHRLQSNLNQFEDKCLMRASILSMIVKLGLESQRADTNVLKIQTMVVLLISLIQNEYNTSHRTIDERTMQEVDPFRDDPAKDDSRKLVIEFELNALQDFTHAFLTQRLRQRLLRPENEEPGVDLNRYIALNGLKLIQVALLHHKKRQRSSLMVVRLSEELAALKSSVDKLLCELVIVHIRSRIERILEFENGTIAGIPKNSRGQSKQSVDVNPKQTDKSLWLQVLLDIKYVNHDLNLYWSQDGLDGVMASEAKFVKSLKLLRGLESRNLKGLIERKIDNFLM